jgi:hypothetical protein
LETRKTFFFISSSTKFAYTSGHSEASYISVGKSVGQMFLVFGSSGFERQKLDFLAKTR